MVLVQPQKTRGAAAPLSYPPVQKVCMVYNTSKQSTTGNSPFFLMFGWKSPGPDEEVPLPEYVRTLRHVLTESGRTIQ